MSKETNSTIRLSQAAKKFNVGRGTILEFLAMKGFKIEPSLSTKLTPKMIALLSKEFQNEKNEEYKEATINRKRKQIPVKSENSDVMSKETNGSIRLSKAVKEFNVGRDTIVEFLAKKGFQVDPSPNTKLTADMYALLVKEYKSERAVKKRPRIRVDRSKDGSASVDSTPQTSGSQEGKENTENLSKEQPAKKESATEDHELTIVEKAQMIVEAGPVNGNEFSRMRYEIASKIVEYDKVRKECEIKEEAHSKTIYRLAKPFLEGHFTLAVVGETSAGKSTFINTLIGDNLFPTGEDQTTSALTFIENGNEPKMEVLYYDGHTDPPYYDTNEIKERLKRLVTIPEEYRSLPINKINQLISDDYGVDEILSQKTDIEQKTRTQRQKTDESLWRKYVNSHTKKDISKAVVITYPLPDEFDGWQIIDTPGVGATGGIQETTQILFNARDDKHEIVDAILYLKDGTKYMESAVDYDFLGMIVDGLTEDAKNRLFFVLTKAARVRSRGMEDFIDRKDKTLQKARELYADSFGISRERFFYIDSVLERFKNDLKDKRDFAISPCPSNWDKEEWNDMTNLYTPIWKYIRDKGKRMVNSSINAVMDEWSGFKHFKEQINQFIYAEKEKAFKEISSKIEEDYVGFIKTFRKEIEILKGDSSTIIKRQENLLNKKLELNEQLNNLQERTKTDFKKEYDFVDNKISEFSKKEKSDQIVTAYLELRNKLVRVDKGIFERLKQEYKGYWDKKDNDLIGSIDFDEIEEQAEKNTLDELMQKAEERAIDHIPDYDHPIKEWLPIGEIFKGIVKERKLKFRKTTYPLKDVRNLEKERIIVLEEITQKAREKKEQYIQKTTKKADKFRVLVGDKMKRKIDDAVTVLDELQQKMKNKKEELRVREVRVGIIEKSRKGEGYGM